MQAVVPTCRRRPAGTLLIKEINVDQRAGVRPQGDLPAWVVLVDLQQLLAFVARAGVTPEALFQGMAVTAAEADEPGCLVTRAEALALMRRVLRILKDPLAGLHIGRLSRVTDRGALGLGMLAASTLGDALSLALRHPHSAGLLLDVQVLHGERQHTLQVLPREGEDDLQAFLVDLQFGGLVTLLRRVTDGAYAPMLVQLTRARPPDDTPYLQHFGCPVQFGCAVNRLVSDAGWLGTALPQASSMASRLAGRLLQGEAQLAVQRAAIGQAVERAIRRALPQVPRPAAVAAALHMGERTLRRRLAHAGLSYRGLLDACRQSLALELLLQDGLQLKQVAERTGFADTNAFGRAFRRWTGMPPSEMRALALQAIGSAAGPPPNT